MTNNCNDQFPARLIILKITQPYRVRMKEKELENVYHPLTSVLQLLFEIVSVARVQPSATKGITDLLLPQTSFGLPPIK